ncbi:glycoside hydrolase family 95 protein [Flavitalea antarctica]
MAFQSVIRISSPKFKFLFLSVIVVVSITSLSAQQTQKLYRLWYDKPAPELPVVHLDSLNRKALVEATPLDPAWENWSLPIGNGYLGASLFGRTTTERIQITENSLAARSLYGGVGLTNFAELYIDFNHASPVQYSRSLQLNDGLSGVTYRQDGITYSREYFASYPDKVMVIKLTASQKGSLTFRVRPEIPYQKDFGAATNNNGRKGLVIANDGLITLSGKLEYLNIKFVGKFKVIATGGKVSATNDVGSNHGTITVTNADDAMIIVAVGTNYTLDSHIFLEHSSFKKLIDTSSPNDKVSGIIEKASVKSYEELLDRHRKDYQNLFGRVNFDLGSEVSMLTTDLLLKNYRQGKIDHYLEELYFQYGRYLLICSSRPGTLPPNLQGIWNQYDIAPWTGGYWHNINIQMNYWPVFNTNLTELFQSFVDYNLAYRQAATQGATQYIKKNNPARLSKDGDNGWTIGTGASAYNISTPGVHSGPGTGAMTSKMFWDYYEFTGDKKILREIAYPAILGMSNFLSRVVTDTVGLLLTSPSYSPEQRRAGKEHYKTTGSAFDQQMIYENHSDVLKAAAILKDHNPILSVIKLQLPKLDPIQVGWSGQIKEYREEKYYGEIVDPRHRHISQLVGLYPGTIINSSTPAWLDAAKETLNRRGDKATGWGVAFRLNLWARVKDGQRAYQLYKTLLQKSTLDNLWDSHPPFQIDGNFGGTAGVAEMLIQSHEGFIDLLPALPKEWSTGSYSGLLARGNFEVSAKWTKNNVQTFTIQSKNGGLCKLHYPNIGLAVVKSASGKIVKTMSDTRDFISIASVKGETYIITSIPADLKVATPGNLLAKDTKDGKVDVSWEKSIDAIAYNVYVHFGDAPGYKRVRSNNVPTFFRYTIPASKKTGHLIIRVTAVDKNGNESNGVSVNVVTMQSPDR